MKSLIKANRTVKKTEIRSLENWLSLSWKTREDENVVNGDSSHASLPSGAPYRVIISFLVGENGKGCTYFFEFKTSRQNYQVTTFHINLCSFRCYRLLTSCGFNGSRGNLSKRNPSYRAYD